MKLDVAECRNTLKKTFSNHGGVDLLKAILSEQDPDGGDEDQDPDGNGNNSQLPWCVCGRCRRIPQEIENRCCRKRPCITTEDFFQSAVLDMSVLSIAIMNRSDVFADDPEYTPASYRKAAYRQWILWQHGYLGKTNRRVVPSYIAWVVRTRYPAPDNHYFGFKEY